jgi:hypothetical protein
MLVWKAPLGSGRESAGTASLCETCQKVDLLNLFSTDYRSPEPDGDCFEQVNSLPNIRTQVNCPLCRAMLQIISSSGYSKVHRPSFVRDQDAIYLEARRNDYALCGINYRFKIEKFVHSCLHIETAEKAFHDKIVLISEGDDSKNVRRPLFAKLRLINEYVDFKIFQDWLDCCSTNHVETCSYQPVKTNDPQFEGRQRVLDVSTRSIIQKDLTEIRYATLTYVWGADFARKAASPLWHGLSSSQQLPSDLPRTFTDAIYVCNKLGIPYLWIDSLCIDQGDPIDKDIQIRHMDAIYQGSYLTIVAIEGDNPNFGLPGVSNRRQHPFYRNSFECAGAQFGIVPGFVPSTKIWNTRAWTLQEALLSGRLLVFNEAYVSFYCGGGGKREDLSHLDEDSILCGEPWRPYSTWEPNSGSAFSTDFRTGPFDMHNYCNLVNLYSSRKMSNPMDALNAVSGLLEFWVRNDNLQFIAGLPTANFSDSLIWFGSDHAVRGHPQLPTWCWAAWQGNITYPIVSLKPNQAIASRFRKKYICKFEKQTELFNARLVSWSQPGDISFGTMMELEAIVDISQYTSATPTLMVTSHVAHFRLPVLSRSAYDAWYSKFSSVNGRLVNEQEEPQNTITLVEDGKKLSIELGFETRSRIELPNDLSPEQEANLRSQGAELLMLKYWHSVSPQDFPEPYLVWALLISRKGGIAYRLGCMAIYPEIWEKGSPQLQTVVLQ